MSPELEAPRRTEDSVAHVFSGYGLTLLTDDIARLAMALNRGQLANHLDEKMYVSAMQRSSQPTGVYPADQRYWYRHGFWGFDATQMLSCTRRTVLPFMSGFGGINVVMMPNDSVFYYFSDRGRFAFREAILASHTIRPICDSTGKGNVV